MSVTKRKLPVPEDDSDRRLLDDVRKYGWHIISIEKDSEGPAFSFSVGMYHTLRSPEIFIMGLPHTVAWAAINEIGARVRKGDRLQSDGQMTGILEGYPVAFTAFAKEYYKRYLGYAQWFYRPTEFPVLQCVWPDKKGKFPWDERYDERFFVHQQILSADMKIRWPFAAAKNTAVFTHSTVMEEGRAVLYVTHDAEDGAWQFLDGVSPNESRLARLVCLSDVVNWDASLLDLGDLPLGWRAVREGRSEPWRRERNPK